MNANFFKLLKAGSVELTRDQLKEINGGIFSFAGVVASCGNGKSVSCSGTSCTAVDNKGCSCDNGADSKSCDQE